MPLLFFVALALLVGAGGVAAVKVVQGRREVFELVKSEVAYHLEVLRPDLSPDARLRSASIVAAQAVVETGGGKTPAWRFGWNFGNVTAGGSWPGPIVEGGDREPDVNDRDGDGDRAELVPIKARFRRYGSLREAVTDFFGLLGWTRYRGARDALFDGNATAYVAELRRGGYFTAPLAEYATAVERTLGDLS